MVDVTADLENRRVKREIETLFRYGGPGTVRPRVWDLLDAVREYDIKHPRGTKWKHSTLYYQIRKNNWQPYVIERGGLYDGPAWTIQDPGAVRRELQTIREEHAAAIRQRHSLRWIDWKGQNTRKPRQGFPEAEWDRIIKAMVVVKFYANRSPTRREMAHTLDRHRIAGPLGHDDYWNRDRVAKFCEYARLAGYRIRLAYYTTERPLTFRDENAMAELLAELRHQATSEPERAA